MDTAPVKGAFTGFLSIAKTIFSFASVGPAGWIASAIAVVVILLGGAAVVLFIKKKIAQAAHRNTQKQDIEDQAGSRTDNQDASDDWNKPGPIEDRINRLKKEEEENEPS